MEDDETIILDKFHWHEALDRTHIAVDTFNEHIVSHPVIQQMNDLKSAADKASDALMELYQMIGGNKSNC